MAWDIKLVTAPVVDVTAGGDPSYKTSQPGWGINYVNYEEVSLDRNIPTLAPGRPRQTVVEPILGPARVIRTRHTPLRVRVDVDYIDGDRWQKLHRLFRSQRLVTFAPNYGRDTQLMTSFNGVDPDTSSPFEVGSQAFTYVSREDTANKQAWPSRWNGDQGLEGYLASTTYKLTEGMIGNAILLEGQSKVLMSSDTMTAAGSSSRDDGYVSNTDLDAGDRVYFAPVGGTANAVSYNNVTGLSAGVVHTFSVYYRGTSGSSGAFGFRIEAVQNSGTSTDASGYFAPDPELWQRAVFSWEQTGTDTTIRLTTAGSDGGVFVHFAAPMFEVASGSPSEDHGRPTSYIVPGTTSPTAPDSLKVADTFKASGGVTVVTWFKVPRMGTDYGTANLWYLEQSGGGDTFLQITDSSFVFTPGVGPAGITQAIAASEGEWCQVVAVLQQDDGGTGAGAVLYENGVEVGSSASGTMSNQLGSWTAAWIGSHPLDNQSANTPLDSIRFDMRAWTAQEVLDNYQMLTDEGVRAFLGWTAGRFFRIASIPKGTRGALTDQIVGDLVLEEVSYDPTGVLA